VRLGTRLWLSGALLPLLVMAAVLGFSDRAFHLALERSLDRALLAQAAIESVSLFDGPTRAPHLHMATSPLVESVRPFAPEGVLFGPDGAEVVRYPSPIRPVPNERLAPMTPGAPPVLTTVERKGARERSLAVTIASPSGKPYTLRLTAGLAQSDAAASTFHTFALLSLLATAIVLLLVQSIQSRSLRRRLQALSQHVEALRAGDLGRALPPERDRDELAALREVLAQATHAIRDARDGRERFIADAAHELRTPLTLMRTSLDLALRRERSPEELKVALHDTREEVDRLGALATQLLDMAAMSQQSAPLERCDLTELVADAVDAARADAQERGIELDFESAIAVEAWVWSESIRRALDNLLSNALKYAQKRIVVSLADQGEHCVLSVLDDGPGIAKAERELIFEPFHRVRGGAAGSGLGLSLVREVARSHGGRAYVRESTTGADLVLEVKRGVAA